MRPENYKSAFKTLLISGKSLSNETYSVGHYLLGLAAECALRKVVSTRSIEIKNAHKFDAIFNEACTITPSLSRLSKQIKWMSLVWRNTDRYLSDQELFDLRLKGNGTVLKEIGLTYADLRFKHKVMERFRESMIANVGEIGKAVNIYE